MYTQLWLKSDCRDVQQNSPFDHLPPGASQAKSHYLHVNLCQVKIQQPPPELLVSSYKKPCLATFSSSSWCPNYFIQ